VTVTFGDVLQNVLAGLRVGSIYAIVGLGFGIIYNATGIINFAQGEFLMVGAMTAWWAHSAELGLGLPVGPAFLLGVLAAAAVGGLFERFAIHPRRRASVITLIIITVAGSIGLRAGAMVLWGSDTQIIPAFSGERRIEIMHHAAIVPQDLWIWGTLAGIAALLALFFRFTMTGKAMRACADNREAAELMGIDPGRMVFLAFVLSATMAAVAGIVAAPRTTVKYDMGAMLALKGFCAAVVGGMGHFAGAVMAGLLLGVMEKLGSYFISSHYEHAIALVVLLIVLFVLPGGLMGGRRPGRAP